MLYAACYTWEDLYFLSIKSLMFYYSCFFNNGRSENKHLVLMNSSWTDWLKFTDCQHKLQVASEKNFMLTKIFCNN